MCLGRIIKEGTPAGTLEEAQHVRRLLDFMERAAGYVARDVIDLDSLWYVLGPYIIVYEHAMRPLIQALQLKRPVSYEDTLDLAQKLLRYEATRTNRGCEDVVPNRDELVRFLTTESGLDIGDIEF